MKQRHKLSPVGYINSKVTTTISITLVLFLLGLILFLSLFANRLSEHIKETFSFDIVLQNNMSKENITEFRNYLNAQTFTKSTQYISKEQAIKELETDLGQNPESFLGFNPLPDIIVVHLNSQYAHVDSLIVIESQLKDHLSDIKEMEYRKEVVQSIEENITHIGFILLFIAAILFLISFALINNTIRLMMYAKRFTIHTMQLVGAKKGFIIQPFILSNIMMGIVAAILADGLLYWLITYLSDNVPNMSSLLEIEYLAIVFGTVLALGVLLSIAATYFAVNKYIHSDIDELYKM
ncbi:MAG: Cell division protein FtsX [Candidatus Ordinivivax streblomastigis]|uniref:Cell division protein FtsX n=1 Tax=Candidatus Ordinivivax streblomastigis TaxID=2540710 RepID=A0A5M8NVX0_9BACT|nr:MAG: Cell division protein FtsX [Candidatus Ordinivivax streblomastigis]